MMNSWKTTVCAFVVIIGSAIGRAFPEYASWGHFLIETGTAAGLLFAKDYNKSHTQVKPTQDHGLNPTQHP